MSEKIGLGQWNRCGQGPALSMPEIEASGRSLAHLARSVNEGTTVIELYFSVKSFQGVAGRSSERP